MLSQVHYQGRGAGVRWPGLSLQWVHTLLWTDHTGRKRLMNGGYHPGMCACSVWKAHLSWHSTWELPLATPGHSDLSHLESALSNLVIRVFFFFVFIYFLSILIPPWNDFLEKRDLVTHSWNIHTGWVMLVWYRLNDSPGTHGHSSPLATASLWQRVLRNTLIRPWLESHSVVGFPNPVVLFDNC